MILLPFIFVAFPAWPRFSELPAPLDFTDTFPSPSRSIVVLEERLTLPAEEEIPTEEFPNKVVVPALEVSPPLSKESTTSTVAPSTRDVVPDFTVVLGASIERSFPLPVLEILLGSITRGLVLCVSALTSMDGENLRDSGDETKTPDPLMVVTCVLSPREIAPPEAVVFPVSVVLPITERSAPLTVTSAVAVVAPLRFVVPSKFTVVLLL